MKKPINLISRMDVNEFEERLNEFTMSSHKNVIDMYQEVATKSAIYPGQGTPLGLMYTVLGLAEAGEVQNKVKKIFRDDGVFMLEVNEGAELPIGETGYFISFREVPAERKLQIKKELGGLLWYVAATCKEMGIDMSDVMLENLIELCGRGERGTLSGSGDDR